MRRRSEKKTYLSQWLTELFLLLLFAPVLSACTYLEIGSVASEKTISVTSASLASGKITVVGTDLDLVTSIAIRQNGILKSLSIESKTSGVLKALLEQSTSLKSTLPATLLISTANAQTPVTLTVDLDGTTINSLKVAGQIESLSGGIKFADQTTLGSNGLLIVADTQPDGAALISCPQGVWNTRILNTTIENTIPNATLVSNQITLPAGTYYVDADAPGGGSDVHQAQLYNVTTGTYIVVGTMARSTGGSGILTVSRVIGKFTLTTSSVLEVRHRCQGASGFLTRASPGWGVPALFTVVKIRSL